MRSLYYLYRGDTLNVVLHRLTEIYWARIVQAYQQYSE